MSDIPIPSFSTIVVNPNERIKVTIKETVWCITSASLVINDKIPNEGRVVLYISMIDEDGKEGEKIAIAPLTIGKCEVVNLDYTINSFAPVIFSTEGCNVSISINGYTTSAEQLTFEKN